MRDSPDAIADQEILSCIRSAIRNIWNSVSFLRVSLRFRLMRKYARKDQEVNIGKQNCPTREAISKSMTALEASSFPSVFKEGWLRLNKKAPFLSGADGVVSKFQQKLRCATRIFIRRLRDLY